MHDAWVTDLIEDIVHGESRYDPVKAHEYYERTKELKGRRSTKGFTEKQREGFDYTKSEVEKERRQAFDEAAAAKKAAVAELRSNAEQRRGIIAEKLKRILERISKQSQDEKEQISAEVQAKIDKLPPIPKGVSKEKRAQLAEERRQEIAKIRGEGSADRESLTEATGSAKTQERQTSKQEREKVRAELSASIEAARENYNSLKEQITATSEEELDKEFENIRTTVR
jgi:hypothetical protein